MQLCIIMYIILYVYNDIDIGGVFPVKYIEHISFFGDGVIHPLPFLLGPHPVETGHIPSAPLVLRGDED